MSDSPALSMLVLTEDSGQDGFATIQALVVAILQNIAPKAQLDLIDIEPTEDANALRSMRGNHWMGETSDSHYYRTTLIQSIATKLGEGGFVVFHCDGDTSWKKRKESAKKTKFEKLMEPGIRARLRDTAKLTPATIEAAMKRVLIMLPHYSIESWLYQNTDEAIRICHAQYAGKHVAQFEAWAANRKQLDEELKPKEAVCLKDKHNHALATTNFPFELVIAVGKSLKQVVAQFEKCTDLQTALERARTENALATVSTN